MGFVQFDHFLSLEFCFLLGNLMCKYSLHSLSHDVKKKEGVVATLIEFIVKTLKIISLTPEKSSHLMNE